MSVHAKAYYEMTPLEYEVTAHSQTVPRWSILAVPPEEYSVSALCRFTADHLRALAYVWGVNQTGSKEAVAKQIIGRSILRNRLSKETVESLSRMSRRELKLIAQDAGIYHSWLNRQHQARSLIEWHRAARIHARRTLAKARHELLVRKAARAGLCVPRENLEFYGVDIHGDREPFILGVPLSRAMRVAPDAMASAKELSKESFLAWISATPSEASSLALIEAGILADGGARFWHSVQQAFTASDVPPLFRALEEPNRKR